MRLHAYAGLSESFSGGIRHKVIFYVERHYFMYFFTVHLCLLLPIYCILNFASCYIVSQPITGLIIGYHGLFILCFNNVTVNFGMFVHKLCPSMSGLWKF